MRKLDRLYAELRAARERLDVALAAHEEQDRGVYGSERYRGWFAAGVRLRGRILGVDIAIRYLDPRFLNHKGPWRRQAHAELNEGFRSLLTLEQPRDVLEAEVRAFQAEGIADSVAVIGAAIEGIMRPLRGLHELVERRAGAGRRRRGRRS